MPGPKSSPQDVTEYDADTLTLRRNAKPNRKAAARLKVRQDAHVSDTAKATPHGFDMHKPGSQNRRK